MGQKLTTGSPEEISRIIEQGKWPFYVPPAARLLLAATPFGLVIYWEACRFKKLYYDFAHARRDFRGDTAFYGKQWGYTTDYLIESSLRDGDLVFFAYDPDSLHLHEAARKWLLNWWSGCSYDEVGIVFREHGTCYVASFPVCRSNSIDNASRLFSWISNTGALEQSQETRRSVWSSDRSNVVVEKYSDKLANRFPLTVSLRRLQCSRDAREKVGKTVRETISQYDSVKPSVASQLKAEYDRSRRSAKVFSLAGAILRLEAEITLQSRVVAQLQGALDSAVQAEKRNANFGEKSSSHWFFKPLSFLLNWTQGDSDNPGKQKADQLSETPLEASEIVQMLRGRQQELDQLEKLLVRKRSVQQQLAEQSGKAGKSSDCRSILSLGKDLVPSVENSSVSQARPEGDLEAGSPEKVETSQWERFLTRRQPSTSLAVAVFQKAGLLPLLPPAHCWTMTDLLSLETLCSGSTAEALLPGKAPQQAVPCLLNIFHVRQNSVERQQFERHLWNKLPDNVD